MRNLFVIAVVVLLIIGIAAPVQTAVVQPTDDHTWGGDPDRGPPEEGWVHWWWYVMNVLFFYSCD